MLGEKLGAGGRLGAAAGRRPRHRDPERSEEERTGLAASNCGSLWIASPFATLWVAMTAYSSNRSLIPSLPFGAIDASGAAAGRPGSRNRLTMG
jgi:hypothetical protein